MDSVVENEFYKIEMIGKIYEFVYLVTGYFFFIFYVSHICESPFWHARERKTSAGGECGDYI